jgi:hypothetical protein
LCYSLKTIDELEEVEENKRKERECKSKLAVEIAYIESLLPTSSDKVGLNILQFPLEE